MYQILLNNHYNMAFVVCFCGLVLAGYGLLFINAESILLLCFMTFCYAIYSSSSTHSLVASIDHQTREIKWQFLHQSLDRLIHLTDSTRRTILYRVEYLLLYYILFYYTHSPMAHAKHRQLPKIQLLAYISGCTLLFYQTYGIFPLICKE